MLCMCIYGGAVSAAVSFFVVVVVVVVMRTRKISRAEQSGAEEGVCVWMRIHK